LPRGSAKQRKQLKLPAASAAAHSTSRRRRRTSFASPAMARLLSGAALLGLIITNAEAMPPLTCACGRADVRERGACAVGGRARFALLLLSYSHACAAPPLPPLLPPLRFSLLPSLADFPIGTSSGWNVRARPLACARWLAPAGLRCQALRHAPFHTKALNNCALTRAHCRPAFSSGMPGRLYARQLRHPQPRVGRGHHNCS
jgi:hypothetical protein